MNTLTYSTKLILDKEQKALLIEMLEAARDAYNFISPLQFGRKNILKELHDRAYFPCRKKFPHIKSKLVIKAEQAVISAYRSAKSNKHKLTEAPIKKRLSVQLDKDLFVFRNNRLNLITLGKRTVCDFYRYNKLEFALENYKMGDPSLFVRNGEIYIRFVFKFETTEVKPTLALGVDLGYRRYATTSEGVLFKSPEYNKQRRKDRYLKRRLASNGSRTAKKHLRKVGNRESNRAKNFNHHLANSILNTDCNVIAVESLNAKAMKTRKHPNQSNRRTQVGLSDLRTLLTYKAALVGKQVVCVSPRHTSQIDSVTNKLEGERKGCRFYSKTGHVYDADVNAAVNIARRSQHPISQRRLLDGQGLVNDPYVGIRTGKLDALACSS